MRPILISVRPILISVLALFASVPVYGQAVNYGGRAYTSRVCSNPNCAMCNRIEEGLQAQRVQPASYNIVAQPSVYVAPVVSAPRVRMEAVMERVPVVRQVKRCNGVTCWYENVTTWETRTSYREVPVASVDSARLTDTSLEPSPQWAVDAMLELAAPLPGMTLIDLGCGDGRILISAARDYGVTATGIELNPASAELARRNVREAGVSDLVTVTQGDVRTAPRYDANIVTMYLFPELIDVVWPKIEPGTLVISYSHELPADYAQKVERVVGGQSVSFFVAVKQRR